jgi:transcriptional regulator with XRE-family HTH domain
MNLKRRFGYATATLRRNKGFTQQQLAERAGISVDFLSLIERGLRSPSFPVIERIAKALEVDVSMLFTRDK